MKAILPQVFYLRDGLEVAKDLLGKVMVRELDGLVGAFKIVEIEAYLGPEDKGAHTYGGKVTPRTAPLFEEGGMTYVYLIYGMYHCLNIGASAKGIPHCVLIRAVEPINEDAWILSRRYRKIKSNKVQDLTNGPGKLCMALNIDKTLNGIMVTEKGPLYITEGESDFIISEDKRINIDYAEEYRDELWRFYIKDNKYVSVLKKGDKK